MSGLSNPLPVNQIEFEEAIFREFALEQGEVGERALVQFFGVEKVERWGSGAGFFSWYTVPDGIKSTALSARTEASGVMAIKGVNDDKPARGYPDGYSLIGYSVGFGDGVIHRLECYNFGGSWPTDRYEWLVGKERWVSG